MEEIFKRNLLNLRQPPKAVSFTDALFPLSYWKPARPHTKQIPKILISEDFSEKKQVLESFERFALEKIDEGPIKIEGGEIAIKSFPSWESTPEFSTDKLSVPAEFRQFLLKDKVPGKVKVIFVTETFRSWEETSKDFKQGFINELLAGFPLKTAELFERMILAMKLSQEEVVLYPVEWNEQDLAQEVISLAALYRPEVIVTLGAKATHKVLKTNDRLTLIHGQFHPRTIDTNTFQVVPLFHPSIIETNQNMKKTAWADMQKIMKHLKKLS